MHKNIKILNYGVSKEGTIINAIIPNEDITTFLENKKISSAEIRLDDGRTISNEQRRKIYATIRDMSYFIGDSPEETKESMKQLFIEKTGESYFSLSNCSMDIATAFLTFILDICLDSGIPLSQSGIDRCEDIDKYLYGCLKYKKCAICGADGEIFSSENNKKICLCNRHYDEALNISFNSILDKYHIQMIDFN